MNKTDIFTIIKNGYVPINDLMEYGKSQGFNFDGFTYDEIDDCYRYSVYFPLLWDGDSYYIDCKISNPNIYEDETTSMVSFYSNLHIDNEETRKVPAGNMASRDFAIKTSEDFINALNEWKYFLGETYINILCNRLEIINELDAIGEDESTHHSKEYVIDGYHIMFDKLITTFNQNIQKIIDFTDIMDIVDDMCEYDMFMQSVINDS